MKKDRDDLRQELITKALRSLDNYDPSVGHYNKYITAVVDRHFKNILRYTSAAKRDPSCVRSIEMGDTLTCDERCGRDRLTQQERKEMQMDLQAFVASLPDDLRDLCSRLKHDTLSQIARDLGVPRTTLVGRVRRLRRRFEQANLCDYI